MTWEEAFQGLFDRIKRWLNPNYGNDQSAQPDTHLCDMGRHDWGTWNELSAIPKIYLDGDTGKETSRRPGFSFMRRCKLCGYPQTKWVPLAPNDNEKE